MASDKSEKVMEMVRKELEKDPAISNESLYQKATDVDSSVKKLTLRQFHARYPLQIKRQRGSGRKRRGKKRSGRRRTTRASSGNRSASAGGAVDRGKVRDILLKFAGEVSAAEDKADLIEVLGGLDSYVDRLEKTLASGRK